MKIFLWVIVGVVLLGVGGVWWLSPQQDPPPEVEFGETVEGQTPPLKT